MTLTLLTLAMLPNAFVLLLLLLLLLQFIGWVVGLIVGGIKSLVNSL